MVGVDPEMGSSALRLWLAAGAAALLVALCVLVFARSRGNVPGGLMRAGVIVAGAILGAIVVTAFLGQTAGRDHDADRRALELRASELTASSLAPGSALPCLDALAGENVEAACEKALFASPATVAVATSYVAARLALLSDMVAYVRGGGANIDGSLLPLRRSLEADRFGFLAHALALRDGCTSQSCKALEVLPDASRVRSNLNAATLDRYLDHYLTVWAQPPEDAAPSQAAAGTQSGAPPRKMVNIDFPTASSIPAISIMNPEPSGKVLPGVAAAAAANPNPPPADAAPAPAPKRARKQAATAPAPAQAPAPSAPAAVDASVDPVWTPAPAAPPQGAVAGAVPAANFAGGAGPIQLNPALSPQ
jgi:hypothetical protein